VIFLCALKRFALPRIARKLATPVIAAGGCSLLIVAYLLISLSARAALLAGADAPAGWADPVARAMLCLLEVVVPI